MNLYYGMKIIVKMPKVQWIPVLGIGLTSHNDEEDDVECIVSKYWEDDTDANSYKVKLIPSLEENLALYGIKKMYSADLKSFIERGSENYRVVS